MAWLEFKSGTFRIGFRFGGAKHHFSLNSTDRKEAATTLGRFESNFRLIEQGAIELPAAGTDLGTYIVSGGKLDGRPSRTEPEAVATLADLLNSYLSDYP